MWPEVELAKKENRHELVLSGSAINERIEKDGFDDNVYKLSNLNYLCVHDSNFDSIPDDVANLSNLQSLALHSNKLTSVNLSVGKLDKLKNLDLSRNHLREMPDIFGSLTCLVTLNVSCNELETFPSLLKNAKLSTLNISNNRLKTFPDVCSEELAVLAELKLNANEIAVIPSAVNVLPALKQLDISCNKIKVVPGELSDCAKLKELNLKQNPITDKRLLKLIDQCRTKQVLDYVKQHCAKSPNQGASASKRGKKSDKAKPNEKGEDVERSFKYTISVRRAKDDFRIILKESVKTIRGHIICCLVHNVKFTEESFKKFIQLQNKLHEGVCDKRNFATIATHDFEKLPQGNLVYTTLPPNELMVKPLNRSAEMSGEELFKRLQTEAQNLRKEKKRNTYSGIHKYLYLIESQTQYPCLIDASNQVVSFPPITNSDVSKIELATSTILLEVTSSISQHACKSVMDTLLKEIVLLFEANLSVEQIKITDDEGMLKVVYPSKTDLNYPQDVQIKIERE